jgi:hypothetical protein
MTDEGVFGSHIYRQWKYGENDHGESLLAYLQNAR